MQYQIRRYQITAGKLGEFVDAWKNGVVPLRERFGFRFHGAWALEGSDEFIWIISHDDPEGLQAADDRYYASSERAELQPDPAQFVERAATDATAPVL